MKISFEIDQNGEKRTLITEKPRVVIGSVESADVKLKGSKIAPIHAFFEIFWADQPKDCKARLVDLASPTGVVLNGKRVVNEWVNSGDLIQVGDALIKFQFKLPEVVIQSRDHSFLLVGDQDFKPIFYYPPPVKDALEVVYSWHSVILNVKHFLGSAQVNVGGGAREDFVIPPIFSKANRYPLAVRNGKDWVVNLDSKMRGILYLKGALVTVEDYFKKNQNSHGTEPLVLTENDFLKLDVGSISFYLSQTVSPPILKNRGNVISDPFLAKSLLVSTALTGLLLLSIARMDVQPLIEAPVPETIATILYHPEKYSMKQWPKVFHAPPVAKPVETPVPEVVKKVVEDFTKPEEKKNLVAKTKSVEPGKKEKAESKAKGGAGARAKGSEGSRGSKNALVREKNQTQGKRPSPQAGQDRGGTKSETADTGNVQLLKGATNKILDLFGGSGEKLAKSGSKLEGFSGFSSQGNGGAALSGQGKGGGGTADTLLGGTSNQGHGGGKVGTGLGAEGTGREIVGGKTRVELNVGGADETVVSGSIDRDAIIAAINAHRDEFRYCYEREINAGHPKIAGKIITSFAIGGSGRASQLAIKSSSMESPNVERCVLSVLSRIQFPIPTGGVAMSITFPFAFTNSSK